MCVKVTVDFDFKILRAWKCQKKSFLRVKIVSSRLKSRTFHCWLPQDFYNNNSKQKKVQHSLPNLELWFLFLILDCFMFRFNLRAGSDSLMSIVRIKIHREIMKKNFANGVSSFWNLFNFNVDFIEINFQFAYLKDCFNESFISSVLCVSKAFVSLFFLTLKMDKISRLSFVSVLLAWWWWSNLNCMKIWSWGTWIIYLAVLIGSFKFSV